MEQSAQDIDDVEDWYPRALKAFWSQLDRTEVSERALLNHSHLMGFKDANSFISVGPGTGDIDTFILTNCMKKAERYYGVEPDDNCRNELQILLNTRHQDLKVELSSCRVQEWTGPDQPVDVVYFMHVLGHIQEDVKEVFTRCLQWLRPGGHISVTQMCRDSLLAKLSEKLDVPVFSYCVEDVIETVKGLGLSYESASFETTWYKNKDVEDRDSINFFLHRKGTDQEVKHATACIDELLDGKPSYTWHITNLSARKPL